MAKLETQGNAKAQEEKREMDSRISGKYAMKGILPGRFEFKGKYYDTREMSEETAAKLVKEECPYLTAKSGSPTAQAKTPGN